MWILILREIETDRISLSIVLFLGSPCIFAMYLSLNRILAEKPKNKYQCNIQFYTYLIPKISLRLEIEVPKLKSIFLVISVILKNKQKTKQKQISKIEKTKILIENPKTHNKNKSNLNLPNKKTKSIKSNVLYPNLQNWENKNVPLSMSVSAIWWSESTKGTDGGGQTTGDGQP